MTARILVAGIGNIFLGDDGFGVEVANRLLARRARGAPAGDSVRVEDFGIRGVHLAYELLDGYDTLILIDAIPMSERAGTVSVIEVDDDVLPERGDDAVPMMDAHSMSPVTVLSLLAGLGGKVGRILVVGCEPETVEEGIGLSDVVAAAVDPAVTAVEELLAELREPVERKASA
jgi:hydrogenase maturation protease